ncbi:amino acid adenylation domain-containing protein [Kitasatospora sp. NBC_01246]|uniref:amino acid adenylation domain-containing protein n=1 Tax=Kitasatospora sp. NBC_01246 TaxID=2903570 RepID=UPI002E33C250|nr:amino acid adenylation domain-containing protein [Kitasatospora sp. NBC_01246]
MTSTDQTTGAARPTEAAHPLTEEQRRLWFLQQLNPADTGFTMYLCRRWSGPLDQGALRAALDRLTARHETLRTRFALDGEAPVQLVEPPAPVPLALVELAPGASERDFTEACRPAVNAPFDLAERPPLRAVLVSAGPDEHALAVVVHHIVSDGWSFRILWRELLALYREETGEAPAGLAPLALRYGDIARAERERAAAGGAEAAFRYWAEKLAGTGRLRLPLDHPRPDHPRHPAGFAPVELGPGLTAALDALARRERCTPFMVLLAAYQCVLARWTGTRDFLVGTPLAGRTEAAQEALVGYFARTGIIRADLTGEPDFRTVLHRVRTAALGALSHQEVPVERLATHLDLPAEAGAAPLYQAVFVHQSQYDLAGGDGGADLPAGVRTASMDSGFERAKTDLLLDSWRTPDGGLTLSFAFDREVLDDTTVAALGARCRALLAAVVEDAALPLHGDWLIGPEEEAELLALGTGPAPGRTGPVRPWLPRFAERVAAAPDAPALECDGRTLSYAELDRRADDLAARLGPVAGQLVAVRLAPSLDLVVALLAVWKAGAGYLPIDPAHPEERRRLMLRESGAVLLLTDEDSEGDGEGEGAESGAGPRIVPAAAPSPGADRAGLAYVLYTSGSTGTPKAVAVDHPALAARVDWMAGPDGYRLAPGDRIVQFASIGFDTHAEELWPALAAGACVVLLPGGGRTLPELLRGPHGRSVTVLDLPTAYWEELVSLDGRTPWPAALRLVVLGGSEARADSVARWRERHGDAVRLVNTYGPTEATVIVTAADLTAPDTTRRPPLGRPLPGVRLYVLDENGALLPRGSAGELHIGGAGLARGYLGRPDLTDAAFRPDPFTGTSPGARMYRTGDRARWRADGQLEYLGRTDEQIKLRGYRIEPAEIEAALSGHPEVAGAAAVVLAGRRLVGYAVPAPGAEPAPAALREHLARSLPAYLVPDTVVLLDRLPLTLNGKLDTAALPTPDPTATAEYLAPRTDAEQLVTDLWGEVLGLPRVGVLDDFFALGGDSLLVTRVVARIRAAVGLDVPIRDAFELSTAAALAARIEDLLIAEIEALSEEEAAARLTD